MMLVLDTHIWLWWMSNSDRLKPEWRKHIELASHVGVSAISLFEVAWLAQRQRIELGCSTDWWFDQALAGSDIHLFPITPSIARQAVGLTEHHSDPQDHLIIATAIEYKAELLSADAKFKFYEELNDLLVK